MARKRHGTQLPAPAWFAKRAAATPRRAPHIVTRLIKPGHLKKERRSERKLACLSQL
jgi:hypothetical protein